MNLAQLRQLTVSYLDDLEETYFTPAQLNVWLNNAQKKVQRLLIESKQNYYLKCVQTQTVADQCGLALPDDFLILQKLELVLPGGVYPNENKYPLTPITLMQIDLLSPNPSIPQAFTFKKNKIILSPIPMQAYVVRLTYSYVVTDMVADTSVPDVPEYWHELLAVYAAIDGFLKDDRDNTYLMKIADDYIKQMKQTTQQRQEQTSRRVVSSGAYGFGGGGDVW